jgi:hypothetical protein
LQELKLHKSLETIKAVAYFKLQTTRDLRYLIKNIKIGELPEVEITQDFYEAQLLMFKELENINTEIQVLYANCLQSLLTFLSNNTADNEQNCETSIHIYCRFLNDNFETFEYLNNKYKDVYEIFDLIKNTSDNFIIERVQLLDYHLINPENNSKEWNIYDEVVDLKSFLQIDINLQTITMIEFMSCRKKAKEKIEYLNNKK